MTTLPTELVKRLRGRSPNNYRTRSRSHRLDDKAAAALIETQATQLSSLRAKLAEAMEVVRPFAAAAKRFDTAASDFGSSPSDDLHKPRTEFTMGDLRAARRLIEGNGNG